MAGLTIVNSMGKVIYRDGEDAGEWPGALNYISDDVFAARPNPTDGKPVLEAYMKLRTDRHIQ
ncbi:MAG: hypothetical protein ABEI99_05025 [Halobaculum sp.]